MIVPCTLHSVGLEPVLTWGAHWGSRPPGNCLHNIKTQEPRRFALNYTYVYFFSKLSRTLLPKILTCDIGVPMVIIVTTHTIYSH